MEILAGLIQLDRSGYLPAPWFNRPALGLQSGTAIHIGVVRSPKAPSAPPDIVVTPLKTSVLHLTASLEVDVEERPGAVQEFLKQIPHVHFNIALTETVTIEGRSRHRITLFLEPTTDDENQYKAELASIVEKLRAQKGIQDVPRLEFVTAAKPNYELQRTSAVRDGLIRCESTLKHILSEHATLADEFDFARVVVSSNTGGRFLRYIFPKHGVFEATIPHEDRPGALQEICLQLEAAGYNVLLSRLSRSNPYPNMSDFVAICEPTRNIGKVDKPDEYLSQIKLSLENRLKNINTDFQVDLGKITLGRGLNDAAYPNLNRAGFKRVQQPYAIKPHVSRYRTYKNNRKAVFLSRPDTTTMSHEGNILVSAIEDAIRNTGAILFDGFEEPWKLASDVDLEARLWVCDIAFFLGYNNEDKAEWRPGQLGEIGYVKAHDTPYEIITLRRHEKDLVNFLCPNKPMITFDTVSSALNKSSKDCVSSKVTNIIAQLLSSAAVSNSQ